MITMRKMKIGFVGVGAISGIYLENLTKRFHDELEIIGVCDLVRERAENAVRKYSIPKLYNDMHELFADPEVDIVLNITRPDEHFEVTKAALLAGKHVYSEKPLASTLEGARELVKLALEKGLELGGAPDTFMGAGLQTCLNALHQRTAQLPQLELEIPEEILGKTTKECMLSGAVAGTAAMIDGLVASMEEELGTKVTLLLTGGGGKYVTGFLRHEHVFDPDTTRKGLALLYELNRKEPEC